jgi:RNA polymerase sigma-70 factor, ECF subfamily
MKSAPSTETVVNASTAYIVTQCLNGHPEAFRTLVRQYEAPLLSFLSGRLRDRHMAEDVAQESFVRAFFALRKLRATTAFWPWLLGIAQRVAQQQRRARQRYQLAIAGAPRPALAAEPANTYALEQAVADLPQPYAEVVLLRYYAGMTCAEAAECLGVPLGTVTKRLSRAYRRLRAVLTSQRARADAVMP